MYNCLGHPVDTVPLCGQSNRPHAGAVSVAYVILWSSGSIRMQRQRYLAVMLYRLSTEEEDHGGNGLISTSIIVPIWVKRC